MSSIVLRGGLVHELRHAHVQFRDATRVMRSQGHIHPVVDVGPFRVVIQFLRKHGHAGHEPERSVEIREAKPLLDRVARGVCLPTGQRGHGDISADTGGGKHAHETDLIA